MRTSNLRSETSVFEARGVSLGAHNRLEEASREDVIRKVLIKARDYARQVSDKEVRVYLVDAKAKVVEHV